MELNRKHCTKADWVYPFPLPSSLNKSTYLSSFCFQLNMQLALKASFFLPCLGKSKPVTCLRHGHAPRAGMLSCQYCSQEARLTTNKAQETRQKNNTQWLTHKNKQQQKKKGKKIKKNAFIDFTFPAITADIILYKNMPSEELSRK